MKVATDGVGPCEHVLQCFEDNLGFFWIPHRVFIEYPQGISTDQKNEIKEAVERFQKLVSGNFPAPRQYLANLKRGDFILVNNNLFLHARDKIPDTSRRSLYRLYLNTDGWDLGTNGEVTRPFQFIRKIIPRQGEGENEKW
jgi:hypothetical protein